MSSLKLTGIALLPIALLACGCGMSSSSDGDDTTAPTVPGDVTAIGTSSSQIDLSWTPSSDDTDVVGYNIYRDGTSVQSVASTTATDTGLETATEYCYRVSAYDLAGNESDQSDQVCASTLWNLATIDGSSNGAGTYPSIAVDSANNVHVSYQGRNSPSGFGTLRHATEAAGSWSSSTWYTGGSDETVSWTSLAIDSNNKVHIVFESAGIMAEKIKYLSDASDAVTEEISGGTCPSIAIDSNNHAHISYVDLANSELTYTTNTTGSFVSTTVDSEATAAYASIALDSNGKVAICYQDAGGHGYLKYATNADGAWTTETVDSTAFVGAYCSLAFDSNDQAHISYYDNTNGVLKYATNASGSWELSTLDSSEYVGLWTSIAVDSSDSVHISYYDNTNGDLKYATDASGSWKISTIDSDGAVGAYSSLAIDAHGFVQIAYYDSTDDSLRYATNQ